MCPSAGAERRRTAAWTALALSACGSALCALAALGADDAAVPTLGVPRPLDPPGNPTTEAKVELGRALFSDRRLSADGSLACASCHVASLAFTDGRALPLGAGGKTLQRNAPTLLNAALVHDLFHDGRAPSLEEQARAVILNPDELGWPDAGEFARALAEIPELPPLFEAAFGDREITLQRATRALAAYERTLLAGDAPFDRWWRGDSAALDAAAERGYRLFIGKAACAQCHSIRQSYALFSDGRFHNTGAGKGEGQRDPGREGVTHAPADRGAFRTPTLRNVALTAPYMHDGSLATLAEVVDFYVDGGGPNANLSPLVRPLQLDEAERADLVAFLHALTSNELPTLESCDRLLADGRPEEALKAFRAELDRDPANDAARAGVARAALALDTREALVDAEALLRERLRETPADAVAAPLLLQLGRVCARLADHEEALAIARAEDALAAWRTVRAQAAAPRDVASAALADEIAWLERLGRRDTAVDVLEPLAADASADADGARRLLLASVRFRRGWRAFTDGAPDDAARADLARAADLLDTLAAEGRALGADGLLYRAYAPHYLGDAARARTAYLAAVRADEAVAERALSGLRNLLARELPTYEHDLDTLLAERPDSPAVQYFVGWERLRQGRLDEAEHALRRRMELETTATAGPHVYLARVQRERGDRTAATAHYAAALALDPNFKGLVAEYEAYIRSRPLDGFAAVDALVADYDRFLAANEDDARFQCLARNNLAFLLREVVSSWMSRGPARVQTFPEGVPDAARHLLRTCMRLYDEAVALIPADAADLPFAERWVYAGVLNDTGLMYHYFDGVQDFARAESLYLRAFELTQGAYQDAYFYNLQFLYAFELEGREERWYALAEVAKDAILREDPGSESGFAPDPVKRRAALRDWERLAATLRR